jgi:futalosine hydrolase
MRILIVSATFQEVAGLLPPTAVPTGVGVISEMQAGENTLVFLVTGIGQMATAFHLGKHLVQNSYDLAINIGIAGTFRTDWPLGKVVTVGTDAFADLGAEDGDQFVDFFKNGLIDANTFPFTQGILIPIASTGPDISSLDIANGITVNKVHGNATSIQAVRDRFPNAEVESMEGAAFFYACNQFQLPALQIRAVSNYVETRNTANWKIGIALENLWIFLRAQL